jgi:hypothetical protein
MGTEEETFESRFVKRSWGRERILKILFQTMLQCEIYTLHSI